MKHPILNRVLVLICVLLTLAGAAGFAGLLTGRLTTDQIVNVLNRLNPHYLKHQIFLIFCIVVLVIFAILLISAILPGKRKRSSNFAIQHNENGMVRISVKALETLVDKVLEEHAEVKVVTSSIYSDEESVKVDLHLCLQSGISMPLAISALQKEIKKYLESCSGVMVQEVRVYVDNTTPSSDNGVVSPYAIPAALLGREQDQTETVNHFSRLERPESYSQAETEEQLEPALDLNDAAVSSQVDEFESAAEAHEMPEQAEPVQSDENPEPVEWSTDEEPESVKWSTDEEPEPVKWSTDEEPDQVERLEDEKPEPEEWPGDEKPEPVEWSEDGESEPVDEEKADDADMSVGDEEISAEDEVRPLFTDTDSDD